jgi:hypothetical protein
LRFLLYIVFLFGLSALIYNDSSAFAQSGKLSVSFEDGVAPSYDVPLSSDGTFSLTQDYSWVKDETSRYNLVSYSIDGGESVKISRSARGSFAVDVPSDSSQIIFSAVTQHALTVTGTNDFSFLPSSPTQDNWFDFGTQVSINVAKATEIEKNKVRQEITGWSLDKSEFWNIEDDGSASFITPPISMTQYHLVDFFMTTKYKLNVVAENGVTSGSGWYKQGETIPIGVIPSNDGLILNTLTDWEGAEIERDGNSAQVLIDGPLTITAKLEKNYSLVIVVIIVPILAVGIVVAKKFKRHTPMIVEKTIEKTMDPSEPVYSDKYDEELSIYLSEQIAAKLNGIHLSKIISDSKYLKIKETLQFIQKNQTKLDL